MPPPAEPQLPPPSHTHPRLRLSPPSRPLPPSSLCFPHSCPLLHHSPASVAKALGVKTVAAEALKLFWEHPVFSEVVSDQEAVAAVEKFLGTCQVLSRPDPLVQELICCPLEATGLHSPQTSLTVLSPVPS